MIVQGAPKMNRSSSWAIPAASNSLHLRSTGVYLAKTNVRRCRAAASISSWVTRRSGEPAPRPVMGSAAVSRKGAGSVLPVKA